MKRKNLFLAILFYIISGFFLGSYVFLEVRPDFWMSEIMRVLLLSFCCLFLYFGGFFLSKQLHNKQPMKMNLWFFFGLFLLLLITLTFFDSMWGRRGFVLFPWTKDSLQHYLHSSVNLVPFQTIFIYIRNLFRSVLPISNVFFNLFGNMICFMPFAFFLPLLFPKLKNGKRFFVTVLCIAIGIEFFQFLTFSGSCDIDDVILNTLGASLVFLLWRVPSVEHFLRNIFLLEKNTFDWKQILSIFVFFVLFFFVLSIFVFTRDFR